MSLKIGNEEFPFISRCDTCMSQIEKYSIQTSGFKEFKITNRQHGYDPWNNLIAPDHYGMINARVNPNFKYHLWFVPSNDLMPHINEPTMGQFLEDIFPPKEQTWNDDTLTIVIDRRIEHIRNNFAHVAGKQFEELGYNSKRIKWLSGGMDNSEPNITVHFPWELFVRTMRFQLNDKDFGYQSMEVDKLINDDYEGDLVDYRKWLLDLDSTELLEKRPYTFLNYNGSLMSHKMWLLSEIFNRGLDSKILFSALNRYEYSKEDLMKEVVIADKEWGANGEIVRSVEECKLLDKLPIYLDVGDWNNPYPDAQVGRIWDGKDIHVVSEIGDSNPKKSHHNQTYFAICNETNFEITRLTSSPVKTILLNPFLLVAGAGSLDILHSFGFKTFPNIFDESYDEIEDNVTRHKHLVKEVERICSLSEDEKHQLYLESIPTIKYNQEQFKKIDIRKFFLDIFYELVDETPIY
jgi:hypothetical protein